MRRAAIMSDGVILETHLSEHVRHPELRSSPGHDDGVPAERGRPLPQMVEVLELREITKAMRAANGNKSRASEMLGLSRFALQRKLEKFGSIRGPSPAPAPTRTPPPARRDVHASVRRLRDPRARRLGGPWHRVPRPAEEAEPDRRAEGAEARAGPRRALRSSGGPRGADRRRLEPPEQSSRASTSRGGRLPLLP
jgi:hypothetical protein